MTDDLVKRLRTMAGIGWNPIGDEAADRIERLERELKEERRSREVAAAKAWEFSERIKELEKKDD
jgi:hypothetical protein